jgi:DNA (cytosine-5)-methyltransferase 1
LYRSNFNIITEGDIRNIDPANIPEHDILCAGFPCQPFSKAGMQKGMKDKKNGSLFSEIVAILSYHKPKYFILENVPFIRKHDNEKTWKSMVRRLSGRLGYKIKHRVYSPHHFGIPQHRERIFIVGANSDLSHFVWPASSLKKEISIRSILDKKPKDAKRIDKKELHCLQLWQEFIRRIPKEESLPGFPIWSMEFDATYPFENTTPHKLSQEELSGYKGCYGISLRGLSKEEQLTRLPSYARTKQKLFPEWKRDFIRRNRRFLKKHRKELDQIMERIRKLGIPSWQKLEWNCKNGERDIWKYIIQFRASGIRIKQPTYAPSLVCTPTQVPIIGWEKRYISRREGARLQSLNGIRLPKNRNLCFHALGNAVNVQIAYLIARALLK